MPYLLALDQGTHASRAVLYDLHATPLAQASHPLVSLYPHPGFVEQDAEEIWQTQLQSARAVLSTAGVPASDVAAIGIANQRETTIVWDVRTGAPRTPAIVWQCRRSKEICDNLRSKGVEDLLRERTGLVLDPYFSATKLAWLLQNDADLRKDAEAGDLRFGTVDSWLLYRLTGRKVHATDASNASRTLLMDLKKGQFAEDLADLFGIPLALLPEIRPSVGEFGTSDPTLLGAAIPITGVLGDQQAALFGQRCFHPGDVKNTYGTGAFLLAQTGKTPVRSGNGLLTTVAWDLGDGLRYALEGSVFLAGGILEWLQAELGLVSGAEEAEQLARSVPDAGGVLLVPAHSGLGAPHWDAGARGAILGLSRGTTKAHLTRAAFDAIAYRTDDVLQAMAEDLGSLGELRIDGGVAHSDLLAQLQADLSGLTVLRPQDVETTARGAALAAGLGAGLFRSTDDLLQLPVSERRFTPQWKDTDRSALRSRWREALNAARRVRQ
ncbi:MAG: glycerol kinase GlpK [Thermaerobacter sp.]|nr:glycerol kinase GlpK [Thermaerobacter sp.]